MQSEREEGEEGEEGKEKGQASNIDGFWGTERVNTLIRETGKHIDASVGIPM